MISDRHEQYRVTRASHMARAIGAVVVLAVASIAPASEAVPAGTTTRTAATTSAPGQTVMAESSRPASKPDAA
ncbi:MAG TPA: hypothetical protein VKB78_07515, partial [Pirellulales bacterium]|nr:hypothetical protein [Pirellulales bacterium]